jgi:hypothetical protein
MADSPAPGHRLDSWKTIAGYLQRDVATVRRWEKSLGLPVRRVPGGRGSSVYAFSAEIDAWLITKPVNGGRAGEALAADAAEVPSAPARGVPSANAGGMPTVDAGDWPSADPRNSRRLWSMVAVGAFVLALTVVGWASWRSELNPADLQVVVTENSIDALDMKGHELWRHSLPSDFRALKTPSSRGAFVVSSEPPAVYAATAYSLRRSDQEVAGGEMVSLTLHGRPRWSFSFSDKLTFGGKPFGAPWAITTIAVHGSGPARRIAVAAIHYHWSPSVVAILDDRGQRLATFSHSGWIESLQWQTPNRLLIGGFSEAHNGGMVAVIDPTAGDGQAPEPIGSPHHCESCGSARPLRMAVMPRTEINRASMSRFNKAIVEMLGDRIVARTIEAQSIGQEPMEALYEFSPELSPLSARFSARHRQMHEALELDGKLTHPFDACPDKDGPREVVTWEAEAGWRPVKPR